MRRQKGSQRTQQRVDHSLSYTMKKKKDLINAECHHSIITHEIKKTPTKQNCGSNKPGGGQPCLFVVGLGGRLGWERGLGWAFFFLQPIWPLGRTEALAPRPHPTPHSDLEEQPWSQREDIIPWGREGRAGAALASRDLSRRGVGEGRRNISKKRNESRGRRQKRERGGGRKESQCVSDLLGRWEFLIKRKWKEMCRGGQGGVGGNPSYCLAQCKGTGHVGKEDKHTP